MYRLAIPSRSGNSGNQRDFNKEFAEFAENYEWDLRDLSVLFVKVFPEFRKQGGTLSPLRNILPLLDPDAFRSVLGRFASGVTILTTHSGNLDVGMTVSAFCSLSLQPPLVLACVAKTADLHHLLPKGQRVVFNILSATQEALSRRFSEEEGSRRFDGIGFHRDPNGVAVLEDVLAWIEGVIVDQHDGGDHSIFVAQVDGAASSDLRPLLYYRGGYAELER